MGGTALIAGVSGVVGYAAAKRFAASRDWRVIGLSRRKPEGLDTVEHVSLDLMDEEACADAAARFCDVTHLVYAALFEKPGLIAGWRERDQIETNDRMLRNLFAPLQPAAPGLRHVVLLQGAKAYGVHIEPVRAPARERWPRHQHENFYWRQEDYLRGEASGASWDLTILRPQIVFGESLGSAMNLIPALGVYGAVLKARGEPLHYPGGPPIPLEAVDADLLADAIVWSATSEASRGETFNITNGDIFVWENVWPAIADSLGMEPGEPRPLRLGEAGPGFAGEWAQIRVRYSLAAPKLDAFVGEGFNYADFTMATGADPLIAARPALVSTIKLRQAGFGACMDTEVMFAKWFKRLQDRRLLPPPG